MAREVCLAGPLNATEGLAAESCGRVEPQRKTGPRDRALSFSLPISFQPSARFCHIFSSSFIRCSTATESAPLVSHQTRDGMNIYIYILSVLNL